MNSGNVILEQGNGLRVVRHLCFWAAIVLLLAYHGSLFGGNFPDNLINMLALLPTQVVAAYLLNYIQIPRLLRYGNWLVFLISTIIVAYLLAVIARLSITHIAEPLIGIDSLDETIFETASDPFYLLRVFVVSIYVPAILMYLIKMTLVKFRQENQVILLEKEKRTNELNFLKAQINPHFLFNTLNNIYSLAKSESSTSAELIMKLSEMLDYTIYECQEETVPISKEWELIESYVDLEALRFGEELSVVLNHQVEDPETRVAPLILISLVENAFKYGLRQSTEVPEIEVTLKAEAGQLRFVVSNSTPRIKDDKHTQKQKIGLQNVRRQLELAYGEVFQLEIDQQDLKYTVELTIDYE